MTTQGLDHPDDREVIKKEIVEEGDDHQDYEWATPDQTPKSKQLNSIFPQLSNTNTATTTSTPLPSSQVSLLSLYLSLNSVVLVTKVNCGGGSG